MKVHELIEILKKAPPDAEVVTEGCDCNGDVGAVDPGVMVLAPFDHSPEWTS